VKYFYAEDEYYYSQVGRKELLKNYTEVDKLMLLPDLQTIRDTDYKRPEELAFLAPYTPEEISPLFKTNLFFEVIRLPNRGKGGLLTTGQVREGVGLDKALSVKLGVSMFNVSFTMEDYATTPELMHYINLIEEKFEHGMPSKGFFISGIPGTGKSFLVKAIAGHLGYMLVKMSLAKFKAMTNGVEALEHFFNFFEKQPGKYILWLDEIEKTLVGEESQEILGEFLTSVNDVNNANIDSNFFVMATANKIEKLLQSNVELFRNGRFDLVMFINNPTVETAKKTFKIYQDKHQELLITRLIPYGIYSYITRKEQPRSDTTPKIRIIVERIIKELNIDKKLVQSKSKKEFLDEIKKETELGDKIIKIAEEYRFSLEIDLIMRSSFELWRARVSQSGRFVYTPAEIEFIVEDIFNNKYLIKDTSLDSEGKVNYIQMLKRYVPLGASATDTIQQMRSRADNFLEV